jgi:integrase/recombinase XerD
MSSAQRAPNACIPRDKPDDELQSAVAAFLSQPGLSPQTRRSSGCSTGATSRYATAPCGGCSTRTAARANEALCLNVEDLDVPNRRAAIRGKNGETDYLHWQTASGHLLSRLIAGRTAGPVLLTDRRASPGRAPAAVDLCPQTGWARLSYRRAQELFAAASGGWTLHQLRHSALTHLAEENVSLVLLMAKSRHTSLRSLQKYARPGVDAVAKLTADHDPARRRRR